MKQPQCDAGIYKGERFQTHIYKGTLLTTKDILLFKKKNKKDSLFFLIVMKG